MSAEEIIRQLPKLPEAERRAGRNAILELEEESGGIALCNCAALEGAQLLDRLEEEAQREAR